MKSLHEAVRSLLAAWDGQWEPADEDGDDLDAVIDSVGPAIADLREAAANNGWRPIETAPLCERVSVCDAVGNSVTAVRYDMPNPSWVGEDRSLIYNDNLRWWRPLPPPPDKEPQP